MASERACVRPRECTKKRNREKSIGICYLLVVCFISISCSRLSYAVDALGKIILCLSTSLGRQKAQNSRKIISYINILWRHGWITAHDQVTQLFIQISLSRFFFILRWCVFFYYLLFSFASLFPQLSLLAGIGWATPNISSHHITQHSDGVKSDCGRALICLVEPNKEWRYIYSTSCSTKTS